MHLTVVFGTNIKQSALCEFSLYFSGSNSDEGHQHIHLGSDTYIEEGRRWQ